MPTDYYQIKEHEIKKYLPYLNLLIIIYIFLSNFIFNNNMQINSLEGYIYIISLIVTALISPLTWQNKPLQFFTVNRILLWVALSIIFLFARNLVVFFLFFLQLLATVYWSRNLQEYIWVTMVLLITMVIAFYLNPVLKKDFYQGAFFYVVVSVVASYLLYKEIHKLKEYKQLSKIFKIMLDTTNNGIQFINEQGETTILNPAAEIIYGRSQKEIRGMSDWDLYYQGKKFDQGGHYTSLITESLETGKVHKNVERTFIDSKGNAKTYLVETFRVFDDEEDKVIGALGIYRDISEQKMMERQLLDAHYEMANMAVTDELTGLYNVRYFRQRLTTEIAKCINSTLSLLIIDVDHFKNYNDLYGHPQGDQVLKRIGEILKQSFRETDVVARYGGEEFTVILPGMNGQQAKEAAERIRLRIKEEKFFGEEKLPGGKLTVTIGIASIPDNARTAEELIKIADSALYKGKYSTRDVVVTIENIENNQYTN